MKKSQAGFAVIEAVLLVVVAGLIAGTGWYVWHSKQAANTALDNANKQNTTVQPAKKVTNFDECAKIHPVATTYPETCTDKGHVYVNPAQQTPLTGTAANGYVTLKEWGIKIKLRDADKVLFAVTNKEESVFDIQTVGYAQPYFKPESLQDKTCTPGVGVYRSKQVVTDYKAKLVAGYYYWVTGSPGACSNNPDTNPDDQLKTRFLQDFTPENIQAS